MKRTDADLRTLRDTAKTDLYVFARWVLGFDYMVPHVHAPVCAFLQRASRRKQLTLPRGFLKTTLGVVAYGLWRAVRNPNIRIAIVMKTLPNAMKTVDQIRAIVDRNDLFRALFPEVVPEDFRDVTWSAQAATLRRPGVFREATFEAAGIGTTLTSRHYDLIIEDDLVAPDKDNLTGLEAMPSREEIEKAIGWHKLARSLLVSLETGEILNIGTRWSKYDLIQYIVDNEPNTDRFELAALDDSGNAVYPERFPRHVLEEIEREQGTYIFASQYLNKPYDEARMVFRDEWLAHTWDGVPEGIAKAIVVDPAISKREEAAYSVVAVLGAHDGRMYVLDYRRGKWSPSELIEQMFDAASVWGVLDVYVEAVQWQEALAHFFERFAREQGKWLNVVPIKPGRDETKELRIRGLQPFAQRGALLLAPWMRELRVELRDFPFSKTKDIADAVAYGPRVLAHELKAVRVEQVRRAVGETVGDVIDRLRRRGTSLWGFRLNRSTVERIGA